MKIYFDVCCLNRPYDNQTQDRIRLESEAVIAILRHVESGEWSLVSSGVVNYEISRTFDNERKSRLFLLVQGASVFIPVVQETYIRAGELQHELGIKAYDALHIACAEQGGVDVFLSTDDRLVRAVKRKSGLTNTRVENPLTWLQEVI
ncbi:putative nucleic acid-binding protein [Desulfobotulus alkaliphilus]|uniref:Putative nucleic acid-binding protein n=1 Tax=Desulfobotulus alkaliphilus TaxID=622671 RepID=A0A562S2H3_9BACT|nr:PIN domain-containing protein [Desulfobotulus alkaliphilus]TWI75569.1 putative nucleic acid-binding protein [Desulfobotulus alkaliphilus]